MKSTRYIVSRLKRPYRAIMSVIVTGAFLFVNLAWAKEDGFAFAGAGEKHICPGRLKPLATEEKEGNSENEYTGPLSEYLTMFSESMKKSENAPGS